MNIFKKMVINLRFKILDLRFLDFDHIVTSFMLESKFVNSLLICLEK